MKVSSLQERRGLRDLAVLPLKRGDQIGLGLWIASTFIAANGGSLRAASRGPDLGTTMSLRLPTVSADTSALVGALDD
jgi:hypothetical protein